jgi:hypothetical protein
MQIHSGGMDALEKRCTPFLAALVAATQLLGTAARAEEPPAQSEVEATASSEPPATPPQPPHEVTLQSGGFLRGTVVVLERGTRVVIRIASGEEREIPWSEVAGITGENLPDSTVATPTIAPEPVPEAAPERRELAEPSGTFVHIDRTRDRPVTLYEITTEIIATGWGGSLRGMTYRGVCKAPCNREIDGSRGQEFFLVTGDKGLRTASKRFTLSESRRDVAITVKPGNGGMRLAGTILMSVGIPLTVMGTLLLIVNTKVQDPSFRPMGAAMLGVGVPSLVISIPLQILGRTRFEMGERARDPDQ